MGPSILSTLLEKLRNIAAGSSRNPRSPEGKGPADVILHHTIGSILWYGYSTITPTAILNQLPATLFLTHNRNGTTTQSQAPFHPRPYVHRPPTASGALHTTPPPPDTSNHREFPVPSNQTPTTDGRRPYYHLKPTAPPRSHPLVANSNLTALANRRSPAFQPSRFPSRP